MKKLGFMILHYGAPYLSAAIEAIYDQVDKIVILYTDEPSQGYLTDAPCPDTETSLMRICNPYWDKVTWVNGRWGNEGDHVSAINAFSKGYDWLVRFDSDEVFPAGIVDEMVRQAEEIGPAVKDFCLPIQHHWRTFGKVCRDAQMPQRLTRVAGGQGYRYLDSKGWKWVIHHMSYCMPVKYIEYKLAVSAHRPEFRPEWLEVKYLQNAKFDLHPVIFDFWNSEDYDVTLLPNALKKHPLSGEEPVV